MAELNGVTIALFRDHPAERWFSMDRYALMLEAALRPLLPSGWTLTVHTPPPPWPVPRGMVLRRVLSYPWWARNRQGTLNHVLDHSYGHLLFALDPERTVVTVHDITPLLFPGRAFGLSQLAWKLAWRGVLRARRLITDSHYTRELILRRWHIPAQRVTVVPLGVSRAFRPLPRETLAPLQQRYRLPPSGILLYVGHTHPRKNYEILLQALALLRRRHPKAVLVHAGKRPTPRQQQRIAALGLTDAVRITGPVSEAELVGLYNLADVFVFPSLYEGFGMPVLEAMACGTPVVCSRAASLPEVAGDAALLVDPSDPSAFAEAIGRILEDSELARALRERGLARSRLFTWERTAMETLKVYRQLLETL